MMKNDEMGTESMTKNDEMETQSMTQLRHRTPVVTSSVEDFN